MQRISPQYLAGVADSCGHFHINMRKGKPFLSFRITNSKTDTVLVIASAFGRRATVSRIEFKGVSTKCLTLSFQGEVAVNIANHIRHYVMTTKMKNECTIASVFPIGTRGTPWTAGQRSDAIRLREQMSKLKKYSRKAQ
jgi:hypothetical protein